jgi:hypothetical protein
MGRNMLSAATITTNLLRLRPRPTGYGGLRAAAFAGSLACVIITITLMSGAISSRPVALAATAFALVTLWCITQRRVDHTLLALLLYLCLLDGYVKLKTGSSTVTLARDALVLAIAAGAIIRTAHTRQPLLVPPLSGFAVAFTAVVIIELANPGARGLIAGLAGVRQHLEFVPLFFLGYAFVRTESQIRTGLLVLALCAAVGGVVSYIQSTLTPEQLAGWGIGYHERILGIGDFAGRARIGFEASGAVVRPFGLGSEVGAGAAFAALALPGFLALLMSAKGRVRWALAPLACGLGLAVATSGSRSAIIAAFVTLAAFACLAATSKNALRAAVGTAVGVLLIYLAFVQLGPDNATSKRAASITPSNVLTTFASERGHSVNAFGSLATHHPLGVGVGTVGPAGGFQRSARSEAYNSETEWNFLVVETGIAGVVIFVAFLLRLIWLSFARIRQVTDRRQRLYLAALAAPMVGILISGFSGPVSAAAPWAPYLWLVAGILAYWLAPTSRIHVDVEIPAR